MNWDGVDLAILGPAFLAGLLVVATHVPLGREVLARGIIFLDLAVAQIAALGVVVAHSLALTPGGWQEQLVAMGAALSGALLLYFTERHWAEVQEAIIGCVFVLAASAGILVLSSNPLGGEELKALLAGQILWVSYDQLLPVGLIYAVVLAFWFGLRRHASPLLFYLLFAVTVTISVQLIGIYLVFASLIIPALAVRSFKARGLPIAYLIGVIAYAFGLLLSALFDLPSGVTIVWALAIVALLLTFTLVKRYRV